MADNVPTGGSKLSKAKTIAEFAATLGIVAVSAVVLWNFFSGSHAANAAGAAARPSAKVLKLPSAPVEVTGLPRQGSPTAPVAMIVFSDFECPFCSKFATQTLPQIRSEFVQKGSVQLLFWDLPLESIHKSALSYAVSAACASTSGKFWEMHDRLFTKPAPQRETLAAIAGEVGVDAAKFKQCEDSDIAKTISEHAKRATSLGVDGTPTFYIGKPAAEGRVAVTAVLSGARPFEDFKAALDQTLKAR